MEVHEVDGLLRVRESRAGPYSEFLRVSSMSSGIYRLPKRGRDPQSPHSEDELYYVLRGRARIRVGSEDRVVQAGSIVFVPAHAEHRFHEIAEDLAVLVFFAPAEGTSPQ